MLPNLRNKLPVVLASVELACGTVAADTSAAAVDTCAEASFAAAVSFAVAASFVEAS